MLSARSGSGYTPFKADGAVDHDSLKQLAVLSLEAGAAAGRGADAVVATLSAVCVADDRELIVGAGTNGLPTI